MPRTRHASFLTSTLTCVDTVPKVNLRKWILLIVLVPLVIVVVIVMVAMGSFVVPFYGAARLDDQSLNRL